MRDQAPGTSFRSLAVRANITVKCLAVVWALSFPLSCPIGWAQPAAKTGPAVGSVVPAFEASDQNGRRRSLGDLLGAKGALLVFFRSADW